MDSIKQRNHFTSFGFSAPTIRVVAKALVMVCAIVNLILSPTYVAGLLKLENEICGFVMFLFVLFGLVALFQASRYKGGFNGNLVLNLLALVSVVVLGLFLASIFSDALANQRTLKKPQDVQKAITLCYAVCISYGSAFILFVFQAVLGKGEV
jgi:Zn-dependent protease with chaperone function